MGRSFAPLISSMTMPKMSFGPARLKPAGGFAPHDFLKRALCAAGRRWVLAGVVLAGVPLPEGGDEMGRDGVEGELARPDSLTMVESREEERLLLGRRRNFGVKE